jgi:membrane associated rhomboid family serine protease
MVFPLYDDNPLRWPVPPFATWGLIAINVAIFILEATAPDAGRAIIASYGATPGAVVHYVPGTGAVPPELTVVTSMFLHGGWEHLLGNMVYLFVFGDDIEEALGPVRFIVFYLLAGIAAALAFILVSPHSMTPLVGASGAISGILAAYLMMRPCAKVSVFVLRAVVRVRAFWVIGGWVLLQLFALVNGSDDGVAYLAHVGGLLAGAVLFLLMRPAGVGLFECMEQPEEQPASS